VSRKRRGPIPPVINDGAGLADVAAGLASTLYELRLYTTGMTPRSNRAVANVRRLCETHLPGRYALEIVDILKEPHRLQEDQVLAAPTLIKRLPLPARRFIGDMSRTEVILKGLELPPAPDEKDEP
jgi:circadian clock protein KaiB